MSAVAEALRGPRIARVLQFLGVDPKRYWLLMDLFDQLSERGEMLDQLGRNGVALKTAVWIYFALSCLMTLLYIAVGVDETTYASNFLVFNAVVLLSVLLPETSNSLLNPAEGLVLAHQPINGATYTAAKLTHLARIVFYLALGLNAIPAAAGLLVRGTNWSYPFMHLLAALAAGLFEALLCCALFGWLMRFVPVRLVKSVGPASRHAAYDWPGLAEESAEYGGPRAPLRPGGKSRPAPVWGWHSPWALRRLRSYSWVSGRFRLTT